MDKNTFVTTRPICLKTCDISPFCTELDINIPCHSWPPQSDPSSLSSSGWINNSQWYPTYLLHCAHATLFPKMLFFYFYQNSAHLLRFGWDINPQIWCNFAISWTPIALHLLYCPYNTYHSFLCIKVIYVPVLSVALRS